MKNLLILFIALFITSVELTAQSVPEGMRYQAIARGIDGSLLKQQTLIVKVELLSAGSTEVVYYTEMHEVVSSDLGLLDFVIGEGNTVSGKFANIPWTANEMWVRISVKGLKEINYQLVSSGQLYSVPYALYAATAGEVKGQNEGGNRAPGIGMYSINWTLEGNYDSQNWNNGNPRLGTTDKRNLVLATNNIHRMVIDKNGMITFHVDIDINGNLNVDGTTTLNNGLDVTNMSPTLLTGTLAVGQAATLNDALTVANMAPTKFTGALDVDKTLNVDGATTMNNALTVTGQQPTSLSGTLTVNQAATLKDDVTVANTSATSLTGSLDVDNNMNVDEATDLNSSLTITGNKATNLTGTLTVDGNTTLNALTVANESSTGLTGTLDVDKTMNVDGASALNSTLDVTGASTLSGSLTVNKESTLNALTVSNQAPTHLTGDLTVDGAVNAGGAITINGPLEVSNMNPTDLSGTLEVDQLATLEGGLFVKGNGTVGPGNSHLAYFNNTEGGATDGIGIQIQNPDTDKNNNFMTFYRGSTIAGRIEGYQLSDIDEIPAPTSDEIWNAVCVAIADYNPITVLWSNMATAFNLTSAGWNATTIPGFEIADIPPFTITDVPALTIPDVPAFVINDIPGFEIPDIPAVTIPDIPALVVGPFLCVSTYDCWCPCDEVDFFTDWDCCCYNLDICAIPEFTLFPAITLPDFPGIAIPDFPTIVIPDFPGIPIPDFEGIAIPDFPGLVIPDVPTLDLSEVFGTCPTMPTFSDLLIQEGVCPEADLFDIEDGYFRKLTDWALEHRLHSMAGLDPVILAGNALAWGLTSAVMNGGVVYGSKGADYAEYLPKLYPNEMIMKGDVVGVFNGKISKNTQNADQILAITSQPLVLGNMPEDGNTDAFEKVAFLGQIPVYVKGPVRLGDYIIPSGNNDGIAKAIPASSVTADMLSLILGKAWSDYDGHDITLINTSIGLRPMEITEVLQQQSVIEENLQHQINQQRKETDIMSSDIQQLKTALGVSAISISNP